MTDHASKPEKPSQTPTTVRQVHHPLKIYMEAITPRQRLASRRKKITSAKEKRKRRRRNTRKRKGLTRI